jgi:hypothetical protein
MKRYHTSSSKLLFCCVYILFIADAAIAQQVDTSFAAQGTLLHLASATAPFPHPKRAEGHKYRDSLYSASEHYRDSTVAIFVPKGFRRTAATDFVIYFHGWSNCVDTALRYYRLVDQFTESKKNAILVLPEGPRYAPDSFGGKLEDKDGFKRFMSDVVRQLVKAKIVHTKQIGRIILAGHSGGYHVMSYILLRGGMNEHIKEIYLFDAWYGQTEKFSYWLDHFHGKVVDVYTDQGGTKDETETIMEDLDGWRIPYINLQDTLATQKVLRRHRLVFLHTDLIHNDVVHVRNSFCEYLKASSLSNRNEVRKK